MIIGLSGYARSGKDEVAKILVQEYGYERVAFADAIRHLLYELNPVIVNDDLSRSSTVKDLVDEEGWDIAKSDPEVRLLLQNLGVGARKIIDEEVWIKTALNYVASGSKIVVTDVRFSNEAEALKKLDAQLWRISRSGVNAINKHVSETAMDDYKFDQILKNEGTLEDLQVMVRNRVKFALNAD
jgi:hypothetical protein